MKTLQSSSRGGRAAMTRGAGRGRGRGDARFASRFTDPRFQIARRGRVSGRGGSRGMREAAMSDPRFAKHMRSLSPEDEGEDDDEEEEEEEEEEALTNTEEVDGDVSAAPEDEEVAEVLDDDVAAWSASDVEFVEPRRRLGIVNCDWDHIRAADLYAILFYAMPMGGQLHNVSIYLSDFGKRMLEHERTHGPDLWVQPGEDEPQNESDDEQLVENQVNTKRAMRSSNGATESDEKSKNGHNDDDDDDEGDRNGRNNTEGDRNADDMDPWEADNDAMFDEVGEDGELFSQGKYRRYERNRMKYYYAIATFDSPATAEAVYSQLDGMDVEASGVVLDLRYVDDDDAFDDAPVSRADNIPPSYRPLAAFKSAALSQTRFRISWDQDDFFRHQSIRDTYTGDTAEDDLAAYIAPPDSSGEDEADEEHGANAAKRAADKLRVRRRYAALLSEIGAAPEDVEVSDTANADADAEGDDIFSQSEEDDDSLNRFSDAELDSAGRDGEVVGAVEGTLDLDADAKAARLQRDTRVQQLMHTGDLGSRAELKYKLRRKEVRRAKREAFTSAAEAEAAQREEERTEKRRALRAALGADATESDAQPLRGREKRRQRARVAKERAAEDRAAKRRMRAAGAAGVTTAAVQQAHTPRDGTNADGIDERFRGRLLRDPRFHLDVTRGDRRTSAELKGLAASVAVARREDRQQTPKQKPPQEKRQQDAAEYFMRRPAKRPRAE